MTSICLLNKKPYHVKSKENSDKTITLLQMLENYYIGLYAYYYNALKLS